MKRKISLVILIQVTSHITKPFIDKIKTKSKITLIEKKVVSQESQ